MQSLSIKYLATRPMSTASQNISRLIRFIPASSSEPVIGEPVEHGQDVGVAQTEGLAVDVEVFSGSSVLSPGSRTGKVLRVGRILSPLAKQEVGTIRCIGLNVSILLRLGKHSPGSCE